MLTPYQSHPTARRHTVALKDMRKQLPLRVLSAADWAHWTTWGYLVVREAVPAQNVQRLADALWAFQEMDPHDPATWFKPEPREHLMKELNNTGMVEIYHHQSLWDNRQHPRVYDAFVDIWDMEQLWVSIDRANLNPPNRHGRATQGFIHWDADTTLRPLPVGVQGVLSLCDQDGDVGGFQCVPELFRTFGDWVRAQPAQRNPWAPDTSGFEIVNVHLNAGDLLIFNTLQAHGIRPNRSSDRVRLAQYISMYPADEDNENERQARIRSWLHREPPQRAAFPGDPREWEKKFGRTATLSPLGERLLGLVKWSASRA
jgi:ectoine hydroxylase-related dioxygenase (phytanoyl-CoA dioxygenase family)